MLYQYEIKNNVLYLYFTCKYEFTKEIITTENNLDKRCFNFIKNNRIPFYGKKVYLIVDDYLVKIINIPKHIIKNKNINYSCDEFLINIELEDSSLCEIPLRKYLQNIILSFNNYHLNKEVIKAICILYNTYAYKMMHTYHKIPFNFSYINYQDNKSLTNINKIIDEINGYFIHYNNEYILPFIHHTNPGYTLKHNNYPYLTNVESPWDYSSKYYKNIHSFSYKNISKLLNIEINKNSTIKIQNNKLFIDKHIFTLNEIKNILNLESKKFKFILNKNTITVISYGLGNSYGLSLYGANEMSKEGYTCTDILKYYFKNIKIENHIKELSK